MNLFFMSVATAVASLILPGPRVGLTASAWRQGLAVGAWELGLGLRCLLSGAGSSPNQTYQSDPFSLRLKYLSGLFFFFSKATGTQEIFPSALPWDQNLLSWSPALGQSCCGVVVAQLVPRPVGGLEVAPLRKQRGFTGPVSRFGGAAWMGLPVPGAEG